MKTRPVEFYACGDKIVGTVYLPDDYQEGTKLPCVIPTSGFTGLNAVYPALFARLLTQHGYGCVGFDYRGWKPSEGKVGHTTFQGEYDDITAAYVFATQQPEFDPNNISLFGWGYAGPVCIKVASDNPKIKAVAIGNSYSSGDNYLRGSMSEEAYAERMKKVEQDRIARVLTSKGEYEDCYELYAYQSGYGENDYLTKTLTKLTPEIAGIVVRDYGSAANFPPRQSWEHIEDLMHVNVDKEAAGLGERGLFIGVGELDALGGLNESKRLYALAGPEKELYIVPGGRHNDWMFDDNPEFIKFGAALVAFYDKYMK